MNKVKTIKIKNEDGSISEESYFIAADAVNIDMANGKDAQKTIGTIDVDEDGDIATQLKNKINKNDIIDNLNSSDANKVLSAKQGKVLGDAVAAANVDIKKKIYYFDTVADMKAADLQVGDTCQTLGYYEVNDGGGAEYKVIDNNTLVDDSGSIHELNNGLRAELIIKDDTINFKQLGAKQNNKTSDCKIQLDNYISICNRDDKTYKLIIPEGVWFFSPSLIYRQEGVWIEGCKKFRQTNGKCTQISPISENQDYIWKIGGLADIDGTSEEQIIAVRSVVIDGIVFAGNIVNGQWSTLKSAFYVDCCMYCTFDNLYFQNIWGTALSIRQSWELYWGYLNFRGVGDFTTPCIHIPPTTDPYRTVAENVSANYFNYIMFEGIDGNFIYSEGVSGFEHNEINDMQIEVSVCGGQRGTTVTTISNEIDTSDFVQNFIFKGFAKYLVINTINIFLANNHYATNNNVNYILSGVIGNDYDHDYGDYYGVQDIAISNLKIASRGTKYNSLSAVYGKDCKRHSLISISNLQWWGHGPKKPFNCDGSSPIRVGQYSHNTHDMEEAYFINSNIIQLCDVSGYAPCLYYDAESLSDKRLVLKTNVNLNMRALAFINLPENRNLKLRIKGEENENYTFRLQGLVNGTNTNKYFSYTGTGKYEYFTCENMQFDDGPVHLIGEINTNNKTLSFDTLEII